MLEAYLRRSRRAAPYHLFFPCGETFRQATAKRLAADYDRLVLVCGHYEGVDERFIEECVDEEISMGDFVLTGGEIPAMALADAVCRLVPGVLPDAECYEEESHWDGLLEYPPVLRPEIGTGGMYHSFFFPATTKGGRMAQKESYKHTPPPPGHDGLF